MVVITSQGIMKVKERVPRTYDEDGFKLRAGCLCFKDESEKEVLLVSSSRDARHWVVPAGGIDPGENALDAAVREVFEEAGVRGNVGSCLGVFQNDKSKSRTYIYSLYVNHLGVPLEAKDRKWFNVKDALSILHPRPIQQSYITTALNKKNLKETSSNNLLKPTAVANLFLG